MFKLICTILLTTTLKSNGELEADVTKFKTARAIFWKNNPPYYLSSTFRKTERHKGIVLSLLYSASGICHKHERLEIVDDERNHVQTHGELMKLLRHKNTNELLSELNITKKPEELIIFGTTSFSHVEEVNKNFSIKSVMVSKSLAVIINNKDTALLVKFFSAMSKCFILIYFATIASILVAFFVYIFEYRNEMSFGRGLWYSVWFAITTMTTVGYGDCIITRPITKLIIIAWMMFGVMMTAMITATILDDIQSHVDTTGQSIAVVKDTLEYDQIPTQLGGYAYPVSNYEALMESVTNHKARVGVMDSNTAAAYFEKHREYNLAIEREIHRKVPVFLYLLSYNYTCTEEPLVKSNMLESIKSSYISSLTLTPYKMIGFSEMLNIQKHDGIIMYSTIAAACLIIFAILSEIIKCFLKKNKNSDFIEKQHGIDKKELIFELKLLLRRLESNQQFEWKAQDEVSLNGVVVTV